MNWTRPVEQGPSLLFQQQWLGTLTDPNWTHIYCAPFSWSVTGMMMPQLEPLTGWLCLPFWKVKQRGIFFFLVICLFLFCFYLSVIPLSKQKCPVAFWESHDMTKWRMVSFCFLRRRPVSVFFCFWKKYARMRETAGRESCALSWLSKGPGYCCSCLQGQNVSSHGRQASIRTSSEVIACLRLSWVLWP